MSKSRRWRKNKKKVNEDYPLERKKLSVRFEEVENEKERKVEWRL